MISRCAIIGAGISGLSAAYFFQKRFPDVSIDIYDASERTGGIVRTESVSGCIVEGGPDSFLTMKKSARRLSELLGLGDELVGSNDRTRKTFIYHDQELKALPDGFFMMVPTRLRPLITTDLFTWPGKLEALADLFSFAEESDCTVSDFVQRRFGVEVLQRIAEPMVSGIYGADVTRLSLQSALPQFWEMQKKGSIIRQLLKRRAEPSPDSIFTTLKNGMESLVKRLHEVVKADWKLGNFVSGVERSERGWVVQDQVYDIVIFAVSNLPKIGMTSFSEVEGIWKTIRRNSAIVFVAGFRGIHKEGFGWLVPESERKTILACTYSSNKFPGRSPDDLFLVRAFIGGEEAATWIDRSDQEIENEVFEELKRIAGIDVSPEFLRIFRWRDAMPEYSVGHQSRMETLRNTLRLNQGLYMTGNIFSGVGLPDCIQHAENVVSSIVNR